ncbi:hypothetical protein [Actinotalea subterranea]|uniref:hypothetical protein n=1 Tax=Actinotalea subterranea TaxID=2607497 RepID=UPI0011EEF720|nr:hypothetical protein [Actinotalea subterranea]
MLQRALASLLCLLGAAAIGLGFASATLWRASDTLEASATAADGSTLLMTDPGVLDMAADEVTVRASAGSGDTVVLALGRTADVEAWIGTDAHTRVTGLADLRTLSTDDVAATAPEATEETPAEGEVPAEGEAPVEGEAPAEGEAATTGDDAAAATPAPNPSGSDLWLVEASGDGEAELEWQAQDGRWSLLVATTGESAGAPTVTLVWPQVVTTPWLVPGVAGGAALLLAGLVWWAVLLLRSRRAGHAGRTRDDARPVSVPLGAQGVAVPTTAPVSAPSLGWANDTPTVAPGTATTSLPAPGGVGTTADPAVPMTRRQLRELDQQRERDRHRRRDSGAVPQVPAPGSPSSAPAPAPGVPAPVPAEHVAPEQAAVRARFPLAVQGPGASPAVAAGTAPAAPSGAAPTAPSAPMSGPGRQGVPAPGLRSTPGVPAGPVVQPVPVPTSQAPVTTPDAEPQDRRGGLLGRLRRRGPATPVSEPDVERTPAAASAPAVVAPDTVPGRPGAPAPSADAWRRAWGFSGVATPPGEEPAGWTPVEPEENAGGRHDGGAR